MAASTNLVDDIENSFQACMALLTCPEHFNVDVESDETKSNVDQAIPKFLEAVRQLDIFFMQKRLLLSVNKPELCVNTDLAELELELQHKDTVLQKHNDRIQGLVARYQSVSSTGTNQAQTPQTPGQAMQQQVSSTNQNSTTPVHNVVQQQQQSANHNQASAQQQSAAAGLMAGSTSVLHAQPSQTVQQGAGYNQGPLAFLEQTTSNIGQTRMS